MKKKNQQLEPLGLEKFQPLTKNELAKVLGGDASETQDPTYAFLSITSNTYVMINFDTFTTTTYKVDDDGIMHA